MIIRTEVERIASETGFRPVVVEKVLRLQGILNRLNRHPDTKGNWVLKGGTALNLFHLDVPRLSVDIDLNYIGTDDLDLMREARPAFQRAIVAGCTLEGCLIHRIPTEHAGGKFRLRYSSVLGGFQNLEVDVSFMARVPLCGIVRRQARFPDGSRLEVPTLTLEELAAGKFAALLHRSAARDLYDAARLIQFAPDLPCRRPFRIALLCFLASSRADARGLKSFIRRLDKNMAARELEPVMRRADDETPLDCSCINGLIQEHLIPALERVLSWSNDEQRFLDQALDEGVIEPGALHDDPEVQDRIRRQPMLIWKTKHVREYRRRT